MLGDGLIEILRDKKIPEKLISDVIDSGYVLREFYNPCAGDTWGRVSDRMYGSKQHSSSFDINDFVKYIQGDNVFEKLPKFTEYTVKNYEDIDQILSEPRRQHYINEGRLSFRGQVSQYTYKRKIPNPVRADKTGREISIFPGLYRQKEELYSFNFIQKEERSFLRFLRELEPNNPEVYLDSSYAYDIMRVEQHYATQTAGLDISFDIETAIFFATYRFNFNSHGKAFHTKVKEGEHNGVIYGFCFRDPPVKKTEFLIKDFDLFKTYRPERVIRQNCGLPLFMDYERNIAITDLDFIIYLDKDFDYEGKRKPSYMFPNTKEDLFYGKLLELKDKYPRLLANIIEYEGSRA
ncbi:FRG domain-containing protein [Serratia plymuthica]|uniref:FRG domain-containing protein n=1 Tax=Serratia plymuthica TaxID=82996 RepID=UPI003DA6CCE0